MLLAERARPRIIRDHPRAGWLATGTVCVGAFMGQLDASIVTLAFPSLQRDFSTSLAAVQWVSLSYLVALVALVAVAGRVADAFGRKLLYLWGFVLFAGASAACALAPSLEWLVAFRVLQAIGAAMLQANSVALIVTSMAGEDVRAALGVQAAAQALGLALGPTLGGAFIETLGWEAVFWINVPVGVLGVVSGIYLLPRTRQRTPLARIDGVGLVLLGIATIGLLTGLSSVSGLPMPAPGVVALFAVSLGATVGFVRWEQRTREPLVDLTLLRPRAVGIGLLGALLAYLALFGPLVLVPQIMADDGSLRAGLTLSALPIGFAMAALGGSRLLAGRAWAAILGVAGTVAAAGAAGVLMVAPMHPGPTAVGLWTIGAGLGLFVPGNNAAVMMAVPPRAAAVGSGMLNMSRGLGTALGVAVVTLCISLASSSVGGQADAGFGAIAVIAGLAALAGWLARDERAAAAPPTPPTSALLD